MLARALLSLAAPPACLACRSPPAHGDALLCPACAAALPWLGRTCARCALPRCGPCPAAHATFAASWAPWAFAGPARSLVHALKFRGALRVADALAAPIAAGAPVWVRRAGADVALVPVPADRLRARRRGLDHAGLLAEALGGRLGLPVSACLSRRRSGARQLGAGRSARTAAMHDVVRARAPAPVHAILVDDVHTTGATLEACARALRAAGARQVVAVTATRALPTSGARSNLGGTSRPKEPHADRGQGPRHGRLR